MTTLTLLSTRQAFRAWIRGNLSPCLLLSLLAVASTPAAEWHVSTNGTPSGQGTKDAPWDLASCLEGKRQVRPGDTLWVSGGTYKHPNRKAGAMGYEVRLTGTEDKPIHVRAAPGQRVTIDGGLNVQAPSTHLWLRDLEIIVSENLKGSRRIDESGSHPGTYDRPWGGLSIYSGAGCKFINLVIHDNAQGVSWWSGSTDSELHGCIIYDNGWDAPDRGHGHAIYTQNSEGIKTISDCLMTGGHSYTLHAYGSSRADVNNYLVVGNICYQAGPFLIGGGKPSRHIQVLTNYLYGVPMQIGYNAPTNEDCEVGGNLIVDGGLTINKYGRVVNEDNLVLSKDAPRPGGVRIILRPNHYDPNRANLAIFNWDKKPQVQIQPGGFLKKGDRFRILNPRDFFGPPILAATFEGESLAVPVAEEFAAFVLERVLGMGGTGDSPVPAGDSPAGRARTSTPNVPRLFAERAVTVPPGGSPGGTAQWPVLPIEPAQTEAKQPAAE